MSSFRILGVMALLSVTIAMPATAQPVIWEPGYCAQFYPNANCQNKGPGNPYTDGYGYRNSYNSWDGGYRRGPGFGPADVAAGVVGGVVGGAVGAAGAVATAPFRGDRYAYVNGYRN